nr:MAG TPA: hypothetical protein [Caudoviricetes sp.]
MGISVLKCFPIPPKGSWKYLFKLYFMPIGINIPLVLTKERYDFDKVIL